MTTLNAHDYTVGEILSAETMDGVTEDLNTLLAQGIGEETVWIPAAAMVAQTGSAPGNIEVLDNGTIVHLAIPFDDSTNEFLNFNLGMPKRYDNGTIVAKFFWTTKSGGSAGNVFWSIEAQLLDDGDAFGNDPSTTNSILDAWQADMDIHITDWTAPVGDGTIAGENPFIELRVFRYAVHGSDTLSGDAYLLGVLIRWTSDTETDD